MVSNPMYEISQIIRIIQVLGSLEIIILYSINRENTYPLYIIAISIYAIHLLIHPIHCISDICIRREDTLKIKYKNNELYAESGLKTVLFLTSLAPYIIVFIITNCIIFIFNLICIKHSFDEYHIFYCRECGIYHNNSYKERCKKMFELKTVNETGNSEKNRYENEFEDEFEGELDKNKNENKNENKNREDISIEVKGSKTYGSI